MKFLQKYKIWKSILILYIFLILLGLTGCKSTKQCAQHQMNYQKIDPTCQTPGYERYWCSKCKYEEIKNKVPPVDHEYSKNSTNIKACDYLIKEQCILCGHVARSFYASYHDSKIYKSSKNSCCYLITEKCIKCGTITGNGEEFHHSWQYLRKDSGDSYKHCSVCGEDYCEDDYHYKQVNLCIETPTPITYYNKIKVKYVSSTEDLNIKFLNITSAEYFLKDIVFIFRDREIHYRDENYNFEFNGVRKNWFAYISKGGYRAKNTGLNLKDIKLDTSFCLDWSAEYPNIYDVVTIKFIFVD